MAELLAPELTEAPDLVDLSVRTFLPTWTHLQCSSHGSACSRRAADLPLPPALAARHWALLWKKSYLQIEGVMARSMASVQDSYNTALLRCFREVPPHLPGGADPYIWQPDDLHPQ